MVRVAQYSDIFGYETTGKLGHTEEMCQARCRHMVGPSARTCRCKDGCHCVVQAQVIYDV
jgi:hypothetical protein